MTYITSKIRLNPYLVSAFVKEQNINMIPSASNIWAVIPAAGVGTRLRPLTHTAPKALVQVAGKPIIGHILDKLSKAGIRKVVLIIGYMGGKIADYLETNYSFEKTKYVEQEEMKGLGHAVGLTEKIVGEDPCLIVYGDTITEGDITVGIDNRFDGLIGVKRVENPHRFGVVQLDGDNKIRRLVEKPDKFVSDLAIVGVNYIKSSGLLFECLEELLKENVTTKGEYQLTDAFGLMVEKGAILSIFPIEDWFDCGNPETLLETNRYLLSLNSKSRQIPGSIIVHPVFISESTKIENSIIGPYVSIADGAYVESSIVRNSIISENSIVRDCVLEGSLIGNEATVRGGSKKLNVGDASQIDFH